VDNNAEDDALLAGMAAGERDAATLFVRRHAPSVVGLAFHILGDRVQAEDVAQEAFWRAWRAAETYDPRRGDVRSWLLAISRNAAIDQVRVRRACPLEPDALAALLSRLVDNASPDEGMIADADALEVRTALRDLPDEQRRALLLATVAGRTAAQIGEIEDIPLGTAKGRVRAGLRRMRDALAIEARRE
jgi:RNA polymerase sigma factor (sigma-70 family)